MNDHFPLPEDNSIMPSIPKAGENGLQVCSTVRLYLAILDDLPPEQARPVLQHVQTCAGCAREQRLMQHTTRVFANLPASTPSPHIDQAIMAAIAARANRQKPLVSVAGQGQSSNGQSPTSALRRKRDPFGRRNLKRVSLKWGALASVAAAVLLLALLVSMHFIGGPTSQAFTLPANLSWNGYVLYHSETKVATDGARYSINTYYEVGTGHIHVETVMPGSLDVVAVGDGHSVLGLDMMHQVAQWGANDWSVDETAFSLAELRSDMNAHRATYLDTGTFHGQAVYRIRCRDGLVLLLNMHYQPVNVLSGVAGPGTGKSMYNILTLMPSSHVSDSMWDMSVPNGFHMGTLPAKP
jgi:hypothetical protein